MSHPAVLIVIGLIVGLYSGILGLGGGTIMIPIMIFMLGFDPKAAVGTSLAIMIPALIPAAVGHYRNDAVRLGAAFWIAPGMALGGYLGAQVIAHLPSNAVRLIFGFVVVFVATYTIFGKQSILRALSMSGLVTLFAIGLFLATRWYDA